MSTFGLTTSPETRVIRDLPFEEYADLHAMNSSALRKFIRERPFCSAPEIFKAYWLSPELRRKTTRAQEFGGGFHHFVLQPDSFPQFYTILTKEIEGELLAEAMATQKGKKSEKFSKSLGVFKAWQTQQREDGREVVSRDDADRMEAMRAALLRNKEIAHELSFSDCATEVSALWAHELPGERGTFQMKARWDLLNPGPDLLDLKTAASAHEDKFARAAWEYGYGLQAAIYLDGARANGFDKRRFGFIAQDTEYPYCACIHWLPDPWLKWGAIWYRKVLLDIAEAVRLNDFPGYHNGKLMPPFWAREEIELMTGESLEDC